MTIKRATIPITTEMAYNLEFLTSKHEISQAEAIRKAVATDTYLRIQVKLGGKIIIQDKDGSQKEIVFM